MRIKMYGDSNIGKVRSINQDSFYYNELHGIAICADGIGGRPGGEVASATAVERVRQAFLDCKTIRADEVPKFLIRSIDKANRDIIKRGEAEDRYKGMGTTINVLLFLNENLYIAHIGDSRTYLFNRDHLWQLTVDHSIEVYVDKGWIPEEALTSASKPSALVRALGLAQQCEPDIYQCKLAAGEIFLTCSDGLTAMVPDHRIRELIKNNLHRMTEIPMLLIDEANRGGGKDNITVIISEVLP